MPRWSAQLYYNRFRSRFSQSVNSEMGALFLCVKDRPLGNEHAQVISERWQMVEQVTLVSATPILWRALELYTELQAVSLVLILQLAREILVSHGHSSLKQNVSLASDRGPRRTRPDSLR